ncbi:DUF308 domain-containing protein [Coprococcus eutactus]|uniref:DUF308 domain-containing protein n=1 Tax=Coprococcus eutactus TaxID=33043 RepID=A0A412IU93_9FIRM|nr:DUF308 domain-containing protein [Coprococcus eutactus]CCZ91924.1 uncharacterized protein BN751_01084 [Coprococcus eutactus CAG:665]MBT9731465.1 DUF308 domain-containing protein [Coprococcus eutactus]MCQ5120010.1 DUF308 domain-containing protein [Coprococcus eutactus]MCQ5133895.1 DUF308 domain-containing protein [Coprococcus eutactus]MCQ5137017.1 DUF308 domain-containing protein [Coprococcus eutactus]
MFNFVMGIVMVGIGVLSVTRAFFTNRMAGYIFFGVLMIGFGIVEMVRSRGMKKRKKEARDREFDMYTMIAEQMGVKINPVTGEVIKDAKDQPQQQIMDNETQE